MILNVLAFIHHFLILISPFTSCLHSFLPFDHTIGSCFDELELNRSLCEKHNVEVAGVIINKVLPEKYEQTKDYMSRAMRQHWDLPLLGCIPDRPYLGCPALADLTRLLDAEVVSGQDKLFQHYTVNDINLVTTSLAEYLVNIREKPSRTLYLCHVTR